jgi:hypothetical protein
MRATTSMLAHAAVFAVLMSAASAQTAVPPADLSPPGTPNAPTAAKAPEVGGPLNPATDAGLAKVAPDGISTEIVPAVPCSTAARETDGTTTCVGIPGPIRRARRDAPTDTTTGMGR